MVLAVRSAGRASVDQFALGRHFHRQALGRVEDPVPRRGTRHVPIFKHLISPHRGL